MPEADGTVRVSVCMAAYRGSAFIEEQLRSILAQLGPRDEVVVIDDSSPDDTVAVVRSVDDPRIRLVARDENRGYVRTFDEALSLARGEYVFLSDQDDVWADGRVERMIAALQDADAVAGNLDIIGRHGERQPHPLTAGQARRHARNIVMLLADRRGYWGSAMGFRRDFLRLAVPFPAPLYESHDLWLAMLANLTGSIAHVEETVTLRRIHGGNQTPETHRGLRAMIAGRVMLLRCLLIGWRRMSRTRSARKGAAA